MTRTGKMNSRFTGVNNESVEIFLATAMEGIAHDIAQMAQPSLVAVLLGGGYGRGEGGVYFTSNGVPRPYNDLDFFVFLRNASTKTRKQINSNLQVIGEKWTNILGVDVDFGNPKDVSKLHKLSGTLMFQELKQCHKCIFGNANVLKDFPQLPAESLPIMEGLRLMMNRGMGILLAGERISKKSADHAFILRNLNKAVLGAGDALLINNGKYQWKLMERRKEFARFIQENPLNAFMEKDYNTACNFKLSPNGIWPDNPFEAWSHVRDIWCETLVTLMASGSPEPNEIRAALHKACLEHNGRSWLNPLKYLVRTHSITMSLDSPFIGILGDIYDILFHSQSATTEQYPEIPSQLQHAWLSFN